NQSYEELVENIAIYRRALTAHGHDPDAGVVTLNLPTFIWDEDESARGEVHHAVANYVRSASHLIQASARSRNQQIDVTSLNGDELNDYLQWVFERLISEKKVLFGTLETCLDLARNYRSIGVDELACQIDFGVSIDLARKCLPYLNRLKELSNNAGL